MHSTAQPAVQIRTDPYRSVQPALQPALRPTAQPDQQPAVHCYFAASCAATAELKKEKKKLKHMSLESVEGVCEDLCSYLHS